MYSACMVALDASAHVCYLCKDTLHKKKFSGCTGANYVPPVFPILSSASQFQYPSPAVFSSASQFQYPSPAVFFSAFQFRHPSPPVEPVSLSFMSLWFMVHTFYKMMTSQET